ncbi:MAG: hypothetical protein ABIQ65_15955 [Thermoanaerobaculia bacterium]
MWEKPEVFNAAVIEFLSENEIRGGVAPKATTPRRALRESSTGR